MSLSLLSYIKFHQLRYRAFSAKWWKWLILTGTFLACTLGCKMVGLLTFCTVGSAVVYDLWQLMDIKRPNPMTMVSNTITSGSRWSIRCTRLTRAFSNSRNGSLNTSSPECSA